MIIELEADTQELLEPLGHHAAEFFLAAGLYHARKISFSRAAHIASMDFDSFKIRLVEHFNQGYLLADECVLEDMQTVENINIRENCT